MQDRSTAEPSGASPDTSCKIQYWADTIFTTEGYLVAIVTCRMTGVVAASITGTAILAGATHGFSDRPTYGLPLPLHARMKISDF